MKKFKRPYLYDVTKDIPDGIVSWPKCRVCGVNIKGKKWRVASGVYECFDCYNEGMHVTPADGWAHHSFHDKYFDPTYFK